MVLGAFFQALQNFGSFWIWFFIVMGVVISLIIGILPGIGVLVAMGLFMPFVFKLSPEHALPFLVAVSAVGYQGGLITAVLLNIPGEETSAATLLDGYPMTVNGEGGRALGAGLVSSGLGGVITTVMALIMIPLIIPLILLFTTSEMVFLIVAGILFIGVLGAGNMSKGLLSGMMGILISLIGYGPSGLPRFTFGIVHLYSGISLVPLILGIFSIPECLSLAVSGGTISKGPVIDLKPVKLLLLGLKDVFDKWWLFIRCSVIGYIVGIIPGIGASTAIFIAYGHAKQTSKSPESFGKGNVEGVIAPQSASNGVTSGSLLTTLALGVPGSATGAILLGALLILGITPGPEMMTKQLPLSLTLMFVIIFSNMLATAICAPMIPTLVRVSTIPARNLFPLVLVIALVGVYAFEERFADVIVTLSAGLLGLFMVWFRFSRPTLLLGFILGKLFESNLILAVKMNGPLFFTRPLSLAIIFILIICFSFGWIKKVIRGLFRRGGGTK